MHDANYIQHPPLDPPAETIEGCVCPQCYRPLSYPLVTDTPGDRYAPPVREYHGFCDTCRMAARVVQFARDGKWHINSFRQYRYAGGKFEGIGKDWIAVEPMPAAPVVMTGPGQPYDTPVTDADIATVEWAQGALRIIQECATDLMQFCRIAKDAIARRNQTGR